MHVAGKVFLGLGVVMLLIGGIMTVMGGDSLEDAGEWEPMEMSDYSGTAGSSEYTFSGEDMLVMVRDDVRCDEFSFSVTNDTGENNAKVSCEEDGEKPYGHEDDPEGWYHMATISAWDYERGEYTIESNEDYELVPMWEVLGDVVTDAAGGFLGILGGVGLAGCGICSLLLGGVLALVLKDPQPPVMVQQPSQ
ncbi:MAG: hypothetical protein CMB58_000580 [Methanobacteriota archaeon]|jgi:hypothetical protein|nr:MAG: hypothetical protein CMB58_000580 [Euryarchaeota archaeon]|tara:strand:- start:1302 stop:1880 length:579 start_codon:yes stop_codon:yes gene_type:complete